MQHSRDRKTPRHEPSDYEAEAPDPKAGPGDVAASVVQRALTRHSSHPGRWEEEPVTDVYAGGRSSWSEVDPDELISSIPPPRPASTPPPAVAAAPVSVATPPKAIFPSTGPVALDVEAAERARLSEIDPFAAARARGRRRLAVATGAVAVALVAAVAIVARVRSLPGATTPPTAAHAAPALPPLPPPAPAAEPAPAVTTAAPAATGTTGTVIGSENHRLYVDGRLVPGWRAEVPCGKHSVRNGSRGAAHVVDVPCGGEVTVTPY